MTDEQIEQLAFQVFPVENWYSDWGFSTDLNQEKRESAIKDMKKVRDKYEQKLALIESTQMGDYADDQLAKQIGDLTDCKLEKHCNKLSKKLK